MKRSELKAIIKECLVEILAEGMGGGLKGQISEASTRQPQQRPAPHMRRPQAAAAPNPMKEHIKNLTQGNSILADVLAHTAVETLPMMMQAPDPERQQRELQSMLGGGNFYGAVPPTPQMAEPEQSYYPQMTEAPLPTQVMPDIPGIPSGGGGAANPLWDALAFGESSQARAMKQMSAPKIPDHVLNRKVSG